jgi:hypothetical protein
MNIENLNPTDRKGIVEIVRRLLPRPVEPLVKKSDSGGIPNAKLDEEHDWKSNPTRLSLRK